ncbi:MAG: hypothetical protein Aurels2KO_55530 [Aureliella sp.]
MSKQRVLVQWIGHTDLRCLAADSSPARQRKIQEVAHGNLPSKGSLGPTKTLLTQQQFDEVRILTNYSDELNRWFSKWLGVEATFLKVELKNPNDYGDVHRICLNELEKLSARKGWANTELCMHLTPGTPAMSSVWLLFGKTRFPATFYETHQQTYKVSDIPFEILDIIPDVLKKPDAHLQHLASEAPSEVEGFEDIVGTSKAIRDAVGRAKRAALRSVSVLLLGESGTGKEMFANAIHQASPRRSEPFIAINCGSLSKTLLDSELFGHRKNAFTGADSERAGAFEAANGGTLFLDEIGDCDPDTQVKLLRVLQPVTGEGPSIRRFYRLGDTRKELTVNVRVIAATNIDPQEAIRSGRLREDLFYRLAAVTVRLPPLRDRRSDIRKLSEQILEQLNSQFSREEPGYVHKHLSADANSFVKSHDWPGNVRQLYNALVQASVLTDGKSIGRAELAAAMAEMPNPRGGPGAILDLPLGGEFNLQDHLNMIQAHYLRRAMEEAHGIKTKAARLLGISNYQTLAAQLDRLAVRGDWDK